jgi:rhodanese-related sulfurtransferase
MAFNPDDLRMQKDHFRAKLASERQFVDAVRKVKEPEKYGKLDFLLLDTRDRVSYEKGHIPGAWSAPLEELGTLAARLPKDRELVTYCWHHT